MQGWWRLLFLYLLLLFQTLRGFSFSCPSHPCLGAWEPCVYIFHTPYFTGLASVLRQSRKCWRMGDVHLSRQFSFIFWYSERQNEGRKTGRKGREERKWEREAIGAVKKLNRRQWGEGGMPKRSHGKKLDYWAWKVKAEFARSYSNFVSEARREKLQTTWSHINTEMVEGPNIENGGESCILRLWEFTIKECGGWTSNINTKIGRENG